MSEIRDYRLQADRARRLAGQVTDGEVRKRLLETAAEYTKYAVLFEARSPEGRSERRRILADA
ncbi:MAG: hypothetical protein V7634_669 [Bradyrhizobium sp.]